MAKGKITFGRKAAKKATTGQEAQRQEETNIVEVVEASVPVATQQDARLVQVPEEQDNEQDQQRPHGKTDVIVQEQEPQDEDDNTINDDVSNLQKEIEDNDIKIVKLENKLATVESRKEALQEILAVWERSDLRNPLLAKCTDNDITNITIAFPLEEQQRELARLSVRSTSYIESLYRDRVLLREENKELKSRLMEVRRDSHRSKKQRNDVKLSELCRISSQIMENLTRFPNVDELPALLLQPLPFQMEIQDKMLAQALFAADAPLVECEEMKTFINMISYKCDFNSASTEMASESTWQSYYDSFLVVTQKICSANKFRIHCLRNKADASGSTSRKLRPDCLICTTNGLVVLRGEEKNATKSIDVPLRELTDKMRIWNPIFYGELSYTLGYATSGPEMSVVVIDRHRNMHPVIMSQSLLKPLEQATLIKIFYNLAFFFQLMEKESKRKTAIRLMPFAPSNNGKRTLEMVDAGMRRTYVKSTSDFDRMVNIYETLKKINEDTTGRTHLQIVSTMKMTPNKLQIILTPLGFEKEPLTADEARVWIVEMLTALSFWHGSNFCHGDIRWRNIVFVPTEAAMGYWMLIDMDESYSPNTRKIDWNHQRKGETLTYQHDFYQLGTLMETFKFELPKELENLKNALLTSVGTERNAQDLLTFL